MGERQTFRATITHVKCFPGDFGDRFLYRMVDGQGNILVWWASASQGWEVGLGYAINGTVKKHDDYKGTKQTVLSRCKEVPFAEEAKTKAPRWRAPVSTQPIEISM